MLESLLNLKKKKQPPITEGMVLLLHFDGENGSSNFKDECNHDIIVNGNAVISTNTSVFGGSSFKNATGGSPYSQISTLDAPELHLTGDFTIQLWVNLTANTSAFLFGKGVSVVQHYAGKLYVQVESQVYFLTIPFGVYGTWKHFALTKQGSTWRIFLDGKLLQTATNAKGFGDNNSAFTIGNNMAITNVPLDGYIDEFMVDNSRAMYTANFTPPVVPFS